MFRPTVAQHWPNVTTVAKSCHLGRLFYFMGAFFYKDAFPDITVIFVFLVLWLYSFDDHETHSSFGCCKIEILSLCLCRWRCFHHFWQHCIFEICSVSESFKGWISKILCKLHIENFNRSLFKVTHPTAACFTATSPRAPTTSPRCIHNSSWK